MRHFVGRFVALLLTLSSVAFADDWEVNSGKRNTFTTWQVITSPKGREVTQVSGQVNVTGKINLNEKSLHTASVDATIDMSSLSTQDSSRDSAVKSAFEVDRYPTASFKSTKVVPSGSKGAYKVVGKLTLHGTTQPVNFDVYLLSGDPAIESSTGFGAVLSSQISRKAFKIEPAKALAANGIQAGDDMILSIQVDLVKSSSKEPKASVPKPTK